MQLVPSAADIPAAQPSAPRQPNITSYFFPLHLCRHLLLVAAENVSCDDHQQTTTRDTKNIMPFGSNGQWSRRPLIRSNFSSLFFAILAILPCRPQLEVLHLDHTAGYVSGRDDWSTNKRGPSRTVLIGSQSLFPGMGSWDSVSWRSHHTMGRAGGGCPQHPWPSPVPQPWEAGTGSLAFRGDWVCFFDHFVPIAHFALFMTTF